jgi:hypothetical protein
MESSVMLLTTTAISSADGAVRQTPTFPRGRFEKRLLVSSTDSAVRRTPTFPRGRFEKKLLIFMETAFCDGREERVIVLAAHIQNNATRPTRCAS